MTRNARCLEEAISDEAQLHFIIPSTQNMNPSHDYGDTDASGSSTDDGKTNLIVNYLPQGLSDHEFYKLFIVVGPIKSCRVMKDLKTGYSYGFGFVEYQKPEDATKAILQLNNLAVQHKRIKVSYARPPGDEIKETNLYIQNIPRSYSVDQLANLFSSFGTIVQKNLLKDKVTGLPRGVGFVRYDKKSEADAAIVAMNGKTPEDGTEPLIVRVAEEHGKMKAVYYAGYHAGLNNRGGKARSQFTNRPGMGSGAPQFGRGNYNNGVGQYGGRGNFNNTGGKMLLGRTSKRYNPIGGGGGFGGGFYQDVPPSHFKFSNFSSGSFTSF